MSTARDIMTSDVTCVGEQETVLEAAKKMAELGVGSLPICGALPGRPVGDLIDAISAG